MPDFTYVARELTGKQVAGSIAAQTQQEALASLAAKQLFPIQIELAEASVEAQKQVTRRVRPRHLSIFYSQLADLLKSGVPLLKSLELLEHQATSPALKAVLQEVRAEVADGTRLNEAMRRHPKAFNDLVISMIRAGEEGGFLEEVLKRVAAFTDHQEELKGRVIGAMVYPLFLMGFGSIVVSVLLVYFVPKFEPIFSRMEERGDLPWATTALMAMSRIAQSYWYLGVLAVGGAVYGVNQWLSTREGRMQLDRIRLRTVGLGRVVRSLSIARFCRVLGTLLRNGVPLLPSLRISKDASGNSVIAQAVDVAADSISSGKSLARPLAASGEFPIEIVEMISVGEEANNLENVLIDIADTLERRTNREVDMVVRLLEPLMLLVMAAIVLFVVIAILLPILQSSGIL
ncbi:MAG: type II secretion system F family protein [Planctomyces sp.]|nr:type II secretion system F family protein [Planctomyces sp.]